jgi:Uma2 family endonuclease
MLEAMRGFPTMAQVLDALIDQRSIYQGITWEQFKLIEQGFSQSPGVRLFYCRGLLEIMTVSPEHEIFSRLIGFLIQTFLTELDVSFEPTGAMTQEKPGEASVQADESYCLGRLKSPADLAIEVVFTSGTIGKLDRYQALGVPEVWFWEDGVFSFYHLREAGYERIDRSELPHLESLDLTLLSRCVLLAQTSKSQAVALIRQAAQTLTS